MTAAGALLGANVRGAAALWIVRRTAKDASDSIRHFRAIGRLDVVEQLEDAMAQLRVVAKLWSAAEGLSSASGSAEVPTNAEPAESRVSEDALLGTAEAAGRLDVSERRVRQLLEDESLAGRKKSGRWLVEPDSLEELVARKELTSR